MRIRTSIVQFDLVTKIERKIFTSSSQVLQLIKNLYGQKQAGRVWNKHLHSKLEQIGFK